MPGDGEHHAPIAGVRNHDRALAWEECPVEDQVHTLAGSDNWLDRSVSLVTQVIAKGTGGVDHYFRAGLELLAGFCVTKPDSINESLRIFGQFCDLRIVEEHGALLERGSNQVDEQSRVVKLAIEV